MIAMQAMQSLRVLLLEDCDLDAELILAALEEDFAVSPQRAVSQEAYEAALKGGEPDVILSDYSLPTFDGAQALAIAKLLAPNAPFIFVSGVLGEEFATEALKGGATDYVVKQRLSRLPAVVRRACSEAETRKERQKAERQSALLVAELSHRIKNTLGIVTAITKMTLSNAKSLQEFEDNFLGRLGALAAAHSLLLEAGYREADLKVLINRTLAPFQHEGRISCEGPSVALPPKPSLALGMVMHELAGNAWLHGALKEPSGRVDPSWRLEGRCDPPNLVVHWREWGGPPVTAPTRTGFGSMMIQQSARYELDGEADMRFHPQGLECILSLPAPFASAAAAPV
ncbi:MAG: response regulator [Hyphomonadaceae bacterium]|nr:response regulator [Hyphomonadaceae bacterium]